MFKRDRQFNIISGEANNYFSQRSLSYAVQRKTFQNDPPVASKPQKLGDPKDRKMYTYNYDQPENFKNTRTLTEKVNANTYTPSMLNYVTTNYNIITHHQQQPTSKIVTSDAFTQKMPEINRKSPLTAIVHAGRLMAPNYHKDYAQRESNREFARKKGGLCEAICNVEKGYSLGKYFRKLK